MARKHILFVTQVLPYPLDSGAKVRAYYMLRHLAERNRVTLASMARSTDKPGNVNHLGELCEAVHTTPMRRSLFRDAVSLLFGVATDRPVLIVRDRSAAFRGLIQRLVAESQFDAVHVDQVKTAQHVEGLAGLPRLIDKHNVYHEMIENMARLATSPARRRFLWREARAMASYESCVCRQFDEILAVTESNARRLTEMVEGRRPVTTIPICVDPTETPFVPPPAASRDILCVGAMFYPPNVDGVVWFVREVFPRIRREVPDTQLRVVGPRPNRAIRRAAATDSHVLVSGYVENLAPHLAASAVSVVPLRAGSGMRVKILDAMVRGVPVVSTRLGAEGISVTDGDNILLADGAEEFARAVTRVLCVGEIRSRLARNARRLVETRYDWRQRYGEVDAVYERMTAGPTLQSGKRSVEG